jgi:hypothetical protein
MASRRNRPINLPAPYLRRIWLDPSGIADRAAYPFCLPFLRDDFELSFDRPITIIVGETAPANPPSSKGLPCSPGYDEASRAFSSSTSRNRRCHRHARLNS